MIMFGARWMKNMDSSDKITNDLKRQVAEMKEAMAALQKRMLEQQKEALAKVVQDAVDKLSPEIIQKMEADIQKASKPYPPHSWLRNKQVWIEPTWEYLSITDEIRRLGGIWTKEYSQEVDLILVGHHGDTRQEQVAKLRGVPVWDTQQWLAFVTQGEVIDKTPAPDYGLW